MGTVVNHGHAFRPRSFHILLSGGNLRLMGNLRVLPGGCEGADIEQRAGALQTHEQ